MALVGFIFRVNQSNLGGYTDNAIYPVLAQISCFGFSGNRNTENYKSSPVPKAFFIVQLSHPYMTTGKTIALTRQTFFGKVK